MAKKYISRCNVLINGAKQSNLKSFKKDPVNYRESFKLMDGIGVVDATKEIKFSFDYVLPKASPRMDWSEFVDATVIVIFEGGARIVYSGVDCLGVGDVSVDGQAETVMPVLFVADSETAQ